MRALMVVAALGLAGCAGSPVGDALRGPKVIAAEDDSYCQSIGAKPGTDVYVQCRLTRDGNRQANHSRRLAAAGQSLSDAGSDMQRNRAVNCSSNRVGNTVNTRCY